MDVTQRQVDDMLDAARAPRCVVDAVSRHARPGRTDAPQAIEDDIGVASRVGLGTDVCSTISARSESWWERGDSRQGFLRVLPGFGQN